MKLKMDKAEIMDGDFNTFSQQWIQQLEINSRRILKIWTTSSTNDLLDIYGTLHTNSRLYILPKKTWNIYHNKSYAGSLKNTFKRMQTIQRVFSKHSLVKLEI